MKTERRQELKTNELSVYIQQAVEYLRAHSNTVMTVGIAVVVVIGGILFWNVSSARKRERCWTMFNDVLVASAAPAPDDAKWIDDIIARWEEVIDDSRGLPIEPWALWHGAFFCLRQFPDARDPQTQNRLLDVAARNCNEILNHHRSDLTLYGAALNGLAAVEQNRFIVDGDPKHKEQSRAYLKQIANGGQFVGSPFQADALARLNDFNDMWQPLILTEPPPAEESMPQPESEGPEGASPDQVEDDTPVESDNP